MNQKKARSMHPLGLKKIVYDKLNSKQQENYNFQQLAGILASYGFNCIRLSDDWQGADFLAFHVNGKDTLKVQLKSRVMIAEKYRGKDIYMAFRAHDHWYLIEHDRLIRIVGKTTNWLHTESWCTKGEYSAKQPGPELLNAVKSYLLG